MSKSIPREKFPEAPMNDELLSFSSKVTSMIFAVEQATVLEKCALAKADGTDMLRRGDGNPFSCRDFTAAIADVAISVITNCVHGVDIPVSLAAFKLALKAPTLIQRVLIKRSVIAKFREYGVPRDLADEAVTALFAVAQQLPNECIDGAVDQAMSFAL